MRPTLLWPSLLPVAVSLLVGCAGKVRPDDLSAEAHRSEAERERAIAHQRLAQYDAAAVAPLSGFQHADPQVPNQVLGGVFEFYNPTAGELHEASRHLEHAREHEAAAAELEAFEASSCREVSQSVRAACPTLGSNARIEDLAHGVRIHFAPGADLRAIVAHMRCHLAFARTRGFTTVAGCPLYMKGVAIDEAPDGLAVDVTGEAPVLVHEIQVRSRIGVTP